MAPLYTIITAGRLWPVGNGGEKRLATLLMLPVCSLSKKQNINGKTFQLKTWDGMHRH